MNHRKRFPTVLIGLILVNALPAQGNGDLREQAITAMKRASVFFRDHFSQHGGYSYYATPDFKKRWGEGVASPDQIFVQPPGTPAVGEAYLDALAATKDEYYLEAARETARALVYGQLESGGWRQTIDFDPAGDHVGRYRNGRYTGDPSNYSSLDDDQTQAALHFLIRLDQVLEFKDSKIDEAVHYALDGLLGAQFANGAFPQGWKKPAAPEPVVRASYPRNWPRTWPEDHYWDYYTLNDGLAGTVSDVLIQAHAVLGDRRFRDAAARLGDFLILAQMPAPQPAWAQQYDYEMHPVWARRFEPPAIAGRESEDAIRTLMNIFRLTGDRRYLAPIPRALAYLKSCRLPDGQLARYYELGTNLPLYMNRRDGVYFLTHDDHDLPSHYGWKNPTTVDALEAEYAALAAGRPWAAPSESAEEREAAARKAIADLDAQGRWLSVATGERIVGQPRFEKGFSYIGAEVFIQNLRALAACAAAPAK